MKKLTCRDQGERIRKARVRTGLSQEFVAQQMDCSRQLVSHWESRGNISAEQLGRLCVLYGCTADHLLFGDPPGVENALAGDFSKLDPALHRRMWLLYQVFIRRGAASGAGMAS